MRFKIANLRKQIAQLHKLLKRFPRQPVPEDVHRLRGQIRTLEAIGDALTHGRERKVRRLLKALILISKAAGKVRDMSIPQPGKPDARAKKPLGIRVTGYRSDPHPTQRTQNMMARANLEARRARLWQCDVGQRRG